MKTAYLIEHVSFTLEGILERLRPNQHGEISETPFDVIRFDFITRKRVA
jgi:hypothetical protein